MGVSSDILESLITHDFSTDLTSANNKKKKERFFERLSKVRIEVTVEVKPCSKMKNIAALDVNRICGL